VYWGARRTLMMRGGVPVAAAAHKTPARIGNEHTLVCLSHK